MIPTVSVLIPCFRAARFVRRAIDSVLAQTLSTWEIVLCDNASDDATWAVAEEYGRRDVRIRVYRNPENVGPVRNWRRCAELGSAPLAALLFADDWYDPAFLAKMTPWLGDDAVGFAFSSPRVIRDGGVVVATTRSLPTGKLPARSFIDARLGRSGASTPVSPGCAVFRRADLVASLGNERPDPARLGFMSHGAGPDLRTYLDALARYTAFVHVPERLVNFSAHDSNLTRNPSVRAAYQAAFLAWCAEANPAGVSLAEARAHAWLCLRKDPLRARVVSHLSAGDMVRLPSAAMRLAHRRIRAWSTRRMEE